MATVLFTSDDRLCDSDLHERRDAEVPERNNDNTVTNEGGAGVREDFSRGGRWASGSEARES